MLSCIVGAQTLNVNACDSKNHHNLIYKKYPKQTQNQNTHLKPNNQTNQQTTPNPLPNSFLFLVLCT